MTLVGDTVASNRCLVCGQFCGEKWEATGAERMSKRAQSLFCPDCTRELLRQQQDGEQIRVTEIRRVSDRGALKAYVAVEVGPWTIRGCRIVQQQGQAPYVSLPQEKTGGRYFPILTTKDTRLKQTLRAAVLLEWGRGIEDDDTEN